jgi:hypothetical protein
MPYPDDNNPLQDPACDRCGGDPAGCDYYEQRYVVETRTGRGPWVKRYETTGLDDAVANAAEAEELGHTTVRIRQQGHKVIARVIRRSPRGLAP